MTRGTEPVEVEPVTPGSAGEATHEAGRRARPHRQQPGPVSRAIGILGELMITVGCLLLLFVAWQLWWTDVTADREQAATIRTLEREFEDSGSGTGGSPSTATDPATDPLVTLEGVPSGDAFAIIRIPRFGADYARPILEGTSHDILTEGVGHYSGTVMPGQVGNFSVAGHRTTYGRPFHNVDLLKKGDVVIVETKTTYNVYRVDRHEIVRPTDIDVISPVPDQPGEVPTQRWMTMTSCHPKFSAQYRYVVFSAFEKAFPRKDGVPASYLEVTGKVA